MPPPKGWKIMRLTLLAAAGAIGFALYRGMKKRPSMPVNAAFADGEGSTGHVGNVRNAGVDAMRGDNKQWDSVDETLDESFPASDPPANY
jgi:hypothetical protein